MIIFYFLELNRSFVHFGTKTTRVILMLKTAIDLQKNIKTLMMVITILSSLQSLPSCSSSSPSYSFYSHKQKQNNNNSINIDFKYWY